MFFLALLGLIIFFQFYPAASTYSVKALRYVDLNLQKNFGWRKHALVILQEGLKYTPRPEVEAFERTHNDNGAKLTKSDLTNFLNGNITTKYISNSQQLLDGITSAQAGTLLLLQPGIYAIRKDSLVVSNSGTREHPIVLAATQLGQVEIQLDSVEGLLLNQPNWTVKNIRFKGVCEYDYRCEHAIHIAGNGSGIKIDNNQFIDFNAALKSNGISYASQQVFPHNVTISNNDFFNSDYRQTESPSSPIDIVGGDHWLIDNNFIADFSRKNQGGVEVVYGGFLKGGGSNAIVRNNVINCAWKLPYQSSLDIRVGFSLGNGGTAKEFCQSNQCEYEHINGRIENNAILNCINDVGLYLNKAQNTSISHNTILGSLGIKGQGKITSLKLSENKLEGSISLSTDAKLIQQ